MLIKRLSKRHSECNEESIIINKLALSGFFTSFRMTTFSQALEQKEIENHIVLQQTYNTK